VPERHGFDPSTLRGSVLQAPLSCDSITFCARTMQKFHGFIEDTYYISDGGMDAVTEMALGFVEIRAVVRRLEERGIALDSYAPRIGILVNCRMDLFEEIALACDLRYMADTAFLTTAFARGALAGDYGGTWFLTRLLGAAKARELYYFSDRVPAAGAERLGLLNAVFAPDRLEECSNEPGG
jgi:1,4-dihydroxy-2-naphthoyl-CoA synthase